MSAPVIRKIGGNYKPYRHRECAGCGVRREHSGAIKAPGHRGYIGAGTFHSSSNMQIAVERREQERLRRDLWLNCERAPFDRTHP